MERTTRPAQGESERAVRRLKRETQQRRASGGAVVSLAALVVALCIACASAGLPPGGPVDKTPPVLVRVTPDTGALGVRPREVVFRFNKVVSERPGTAASLEDLVVVSPSDGLVNVEWRREAIVVRPRKGWRPNTTYTVTLLAGVSDLRNNRLTKALSLEFSTGSTASHGVVRGVAFDWVGQQVARGARVEATAGSDTLFRYVAVADSAGRFALTSLPPGDWHVRVYRDDNNNRVFDARLRELFDSATVTVADSARHDFYLFVHDSIAPRPTNVTAVDSVTVRMGFDKPLSPAVRLDVSHFTVIRRSDSSRVAIRSALPAAEYDSLAAQRKRVQQDSISKADTSAAGRRARARADSLARVHVADSLSAAQLALLKASRDTAKRDTLPRPGRPAPLIAYVIELENPLESKVPMLLEVRDVTGLTGAHLTTIRSFQWNRPAPPAAKDSAAAKAPVKKP
jgi:Big-like domain-containing protein